MTTHRMAIVATLACGMVVSAWHPEVLAADNEFTIGGQWFDQTVPEAKFQEFREIARGGFLESFLFREWAGRNSVALWGANGIRSDQVSKLTWANGARWRVDLGYQQIPHTFSQVARWGWFQSAPGVFTLPDAVYKSLASMVTNGFVYLRQDEDGYWYFLGRSTDMIRRGGINVSPVEVQNVLLRHPHVSDVAISAVPDELYGEAVGALVVGRFASSEDALVRLRAFAIGTLADFKIPTVVRHVRAIPRTPTGKLDQRTIRDQSSSCSASRP